MKKACSLIILVALVVLIPSIQGSCQDNRVDLFVGATFLHSGDLPSHVSGVPGFLKSGVNLPGVSGAISVNANRFFSLVGEVNLDHSSSENLFTFLGGPELSIRSSKSRVFFHALAGGAYERHSLTGAKISELSDSSFAYELGGGWDLGLNKTVALRLIQLDYLYTEAFHLSDQNLKASAGIVFRW